ncbi:MAG: hypothetical protein L6U99_00670 [Clostridium sp.]|nr:MAG: hypothetical protein L6U99_00670 [Clostridium sp.]
MLKKYSNEQPLYLEIKAMADKIVAEQKAKDEEALALKKEEAKKAAFEKKKKEEEARIAKEEALKSGG